jgi:hypothetical protein
MAAVKIGRLKRNETKRCDWMRGKRERKSEKMKRTEMNLTENLTDLEQTVRGEASQHFPPRPARRPELSRGSERDQRWFKPETKLFGKS